MKVTTRGIRIKRNGDKSVLKLEEFELEGSADSILIRNSFAGINFIDVYHREGLYAMKMPFIMGVEGGGTVLASSNSAFREGDQVIFLGMSGGYAEHSFVPADQVIKIPRTIPLKTAVAGLLQGLTADMLTDFVYRVRAGDSCLIHAAAGGVGSMLVQMAKDRGAIVLGTVSTDEKAAMARSLGADYLINYRQEDFQKRVREITQGTGVNVVYDSIGKDTFHKSLDSLARFGHMVSFGNTSGPVPAISPLELMSRGSLFLARPSIFHYIKDRERFLACAKRLFNLISAGRLKVTIGLELPLEEVRQAHKVLEGRKTKGKVLLTIP